MAEFYKMPAVSPTMETGTIVKWRIQEGEKFESSAVMAEIGTDKATMEAEIFDAGVMIKHLLAEGEEAPTDFPIAIIGKKADEDITALVAEFAKMPRTGSTPKPADEPAKPADEAAKPADEPAAAPLPSAVDTPTQAQPKPREAPAPTSAPRAEPATLSRDVGTPDREWMGKKLGTEFLDPPGDIRVGSLPKSGTRIVASPLAKKVAEDRGVDLSRVKGSGPGGRIVQKDVEAANVAPKGPSQATSRPDEVVRNSPMRKTIAKRLLQSTQGTPTFTLTISLDVQGFVDLRAEVKKRLPDVKISYNDILVACVARALREFPRANASWADGEITRHGRVDIGVAVAVADGLITPVLRDADRLSFTQIGSQARDLAARARDGKLKPEEYTGSTFTISNLGMYDIDHFTAIINPPEAAILAVGSIAQVPVVRDGALAVGWRMNVTMTCDHRVVDGATGAEFLQVLRRYVESPTLLLV